MKVGKGKNKRYVYKPYKGFGQQNVIEKEISSQDMVEPLLSGESLLFCARMQDETGSGGDIMSLMEISKLSEIENFQLAYDFATQSEVVKLGIRRQHEQGRGFLNMMDAAYRRMIGVYDASATDNVIFNWFTISELKQTPRESPLFVNTNALKPLTLALSTNCDAAHEFPCLFNGIPMDKEAKSRCHLLFMVKDSSSSNLKLNVRTKEIFI